MFTLKKIALLGAAGLAAFSMSCSDDGDADKGGSITGLSIAAGDLTEYVVKGEVKATEGNFVQKVTLTAEKALMIADASEPGATVTVTPAAETNAVSLNVMLQPACGTGSITIKVTAVAEFVSGEKVTETATKTHACTAGGNDLNKKTITVGGTGAAGSFVDLDPATPKVITQAQFAANISDIDIIYATAFGGGDKIYSTSGAAFGDTELASSGAAGDISGQLLDMDDFSEIYSLTSTQKSTVKSATSLGDLSDIINGFGDDEESVDATADNVFAVFTTEGNHVFVIVDEKDGTKELTLIAIK